MNMIALIDCNNFFVGCEALFNPSLLNKAVCVLSNNNGCVIARSNEAKKLGIKMGMPYFMAKKQFKDVIYLSGNHSLYNEISNRIMKKLYDYTPNVEVYSIDEAFLEVPVMDYKKIKTEIKNEIGIDVSIGIATSKTLAKLASEKAKCGNGVHEIKNIEEELLKTPIEDIWGIGYNTSRLLRKHFIKTAYNLVQQNDSWLKRIMGKNGLDLKQELLGNSISRVNPRFTLPKSVQKTSSFPEFTTDKNYIKDTLSYHSHRVCAKLRKLELTGQTLIVMLRTKDFQIIEEKIKLAAPTNSEFEINKAIALVFEKMYNPYITYRSSGITIAKLTTINQLSLFNPQNKHKNLPEIWDKIEKKFGRGKLHLGTNAIQK